MITIDEYNTSIDVSNERYINIALINVGPDVRVELIEKSGWHLSTETVLDSATGLPEDIEDYIYVTYGLNVSIDM